MKSKSTPRDVFLYLLMIVTLYIGVVAFIGLWFGLIDLWLPDPTEFFRGSSNAIRNAIASMIVVCPLFLFISWIIEKDMRKDKTKRDIGIRRWLLYLTLFIAAITIIIDLISLITNFLDGDLTTRFVLKVITVLIVIGIVFGYYLWQLKENLQPGKYPFHAGVIATIAVVLSIGLGLWYAGSPSDQRAEKLDAERVRHLQQLANNVQSFYSLNNRLPDTIDELESQKFVPLRDPVSGEPYGYEALGNLRFNICGEFDTEGIDELGIREPRPTGLVSFDPALFDWSHPEGNHCFTRQIFTENI